PRGCYLVTVDSKNQHSMEFIETDSIRWFIKDISIEDMETEADLLQSIQECADAVNDEADGRSVICRYILTGRGALHRSFMREGMLDDILQHLREELTFNSQFVWIERLVNDTKLPINRDVLQGRNDFVGDIVNIVDEIYKDENTLMDLKTSLKPLFASPNGRKILKEIEYPELMDLIQRAESLLLDQLIIEEKHENQ
ncbi:MAG: phosphoesterase, partial [Methanosarcinales archaeon]|nr:phosphoesterase [Methanosarcinales archaeon]